MTPDHDENRKKRIRDLNAEGYRVLAIAYRVFPCDNGQPHYTVQDESNLTLLGYMAFLDPPKDTAPEALSKLKEHSVTVKILTGDNDIVTGSICKQVGLPVDRILLGDEIEGMNEAQLAEAAEMTSDEVSRIERGTREPRFATIERLAAALDAPPRKLFDGATD